MSHQGRKNADELLLTTLAGGASVQAAAQLCDVSERTVNRRLADPEFRRKLNDARAQMVERALGHLSEGAAEASIVLRNLMANKDTADTVKLAAARAVLELGHKLRDGVDHEQRLAEIERLLAQKGKP